LSSRQVTISNSSYTLLLVCQASYIAYSEVVGRSTPISNQIVISLIKM